MHRGDSVVAVGLQLLDIACTYAMCLDGLNLNNVAILEVEVSDAFTRVEQTSHTSVSGSSLATDDGMLTDMGW